MAKYYAEINGKETGPHEAGTLRGWFESGFLHPNDIVWVDGEFGRSPAWAYPEIVGQKSGEEAKLLKDWSRPEPLTPKQAAGRSAILRGISFLSAGGTMLFLSSILSSGPLSLIAMGPLIYGGWLFTKGLVDHFTKG